MKKKIAWWLPVALVVCLLTAGCSTDDTQTESSHVHEFDEWVTVTEPTCTETGMQERSCACGATEQETLNALGHSLVGDKCERCGREASEGLEFFSASDDSSYSVSGIGSCTDTDILIPAEYEGKPVIWIRDEAFLDCSDLTSITIPDSVTHISRYAFSGCSGLMNITIGGNVTYIGEWAFRGCTGLTSITIPDSVTSIGDYAFEYCSGLTSVTIPDGVTRIGYVAFGDCSGLTSIAIPNSVTRIDGYSFSGCKSLESITVAEGNTVYHAIENCLVETASKTLIAGCKNSVIPTDGSVSSIGGRAFEECSGLTSITIPDSVTSIGEWAFYGCSGLTSITIPDSVTSIGNRAFDGCKSLTSITIPDSVTEIGSFAFSGCTGLTSITIPDSVTSINQHAFSGCSGLESITIPDSVTEIGEYAFYSCSNLTSITVGENNASYHAFGNCLVETASKTLIAGCKNSVIPTDGSVTSISVYAFRNCSGLTSITIPDGVTEIGSDAFSGCSSLTSITIPDGVTSIGRAAFAECENLTSITYTGTKAQWEAIGKGRGWDGNTGSFTVHCTDGDISYEDS